MVKRRFVDHGRWLAGFANQFVVRCPRCGAAATVNRDWDFTRRRWMAATAVCVSCGFSRRQQPAGGCECGRCRREVPDGWAGPVMIAVHRRCGNCGRPMQIRRRARAVPPSRLLTLNCDGCGTSTDVSYGMWPVTVPDALVDNCFGLSLLLQVPCAGHVLWAFNARHLAYLKEFLQADLREQRGATNASVVSRLPGWLKQAKHRAEALRAVARLERLL